MIICQVGIKSSRIEDWNSIQLKPEFKWSKNSEEMENRVQRETQCKFTGQYDINAGQVLLNLKNRAQRSDSTLATQLYHALRYPTLHYDATRR